MRFGNPQKEPAEQAAGMSLTRKNRRFRDKEAAASGVCSVGQADQRVSTHETRRAVSASARQLFGTGTHGRLKTERRQIRSSRAANADRPAASGSARQRRQNPQAGDPQTGRQ